MSSLGHLPRLILASGSPRRLDILHAHGLDPEVYLPDVDETLAEGLTLATLPAALEALALAKAHSVLERLQQAGQLDRGEEVLVIAADTVVFADAVLGKPADHVAAVQTLMSLSGRSHLVLTAVAVVRWPNGPVASLTDIAEVRFKTYNREQIEAYITAEPPYDKAGAYAIQGIWQSQVAELKGDIETVIGLPFRRLAELF